MKEVNVEYRVTGYADGSYRYTLMTEILEAFPRYGGKEIFVPVGEESDGATKAIDIQGSRSWWVHDKVCKDPRWRDGTPITAWQAARILSDTLLKEAKQVEGMWKKLRRQTAGYYWFWATFFLGCKLARQNGWF